MIMKKIYWVMIGIGLYLFVGFDYVILNVKNLDAVDIIVLVSFMIGVLSGVYGIYTLINRLRKPQTVLKT